VDAPAAAMILGPLKLHTEIEQWKLAVPFRITGLTRTAIEVLVVSLTKDGLTGHAEALGVRYHGENARSLQAQVESLRPAIEAGVTPESLQRMLPVGGARNGLDGALWDLAAKITGRSVWQIAGLQSPRPVLNAFTCSADTPDNMAIAAVAYRGAKAIKLKLTGDQVDSERVRAVRAARSDVRLSVDANQGFTPDILAKLMPALVDAGVQLIEQPFPAEHDTWLDGFRSPIPFAADESVQGLADIERLAGRFKALNIKLDKCGGLTEALSMARLARSLELEPWVGCMLGTSLAMAPAFIAGQLCTSVELDAPVFLQHDRGTTVVYEDGFVMCPQELWGSPAACNPERGH